MSFEKIKKLLKLHKNSDFLNYPCDDLIKMEPEQFLKLYKEAKNKFTIWDAFLNKSFEQQLIEPKLLNPTVEALVRAEFFSEIRHLFETKNIKKQIDIQRNMIIIFLLAQKNNSFRTHKYLKTYNIFTEIQPAYELKRQDDCKKLVLFIMENKLFTWNDFPEHLLHQSVEKFYQIEKEKFNIKLDLTVLGNTTLESKPRLRVL